MMLPLVKPLKGDINLSAEEVMDGLLPSVEFRLF
jgi:hypothetical protein